MDSASALVKWVQYVQRRWWWNDMTWKVDCWFAQEQYNARTSVKIHTKHEILITCRAMIPFSLRDKKLHQDRRFSGVSWLMVNVWFKTYIKTKGMYNIRKNFKFDHVIPFNWICFLRLRKTFKLEEFKCISVVAELSSFDQHVFLHQQLFQRNHNNYLRIYRFF